MVHVYLAPSWTTQFGGFVGGRSLAKQVLSHVRDWFQDSSLETKFKITYKYFNFYKTDAELSLSRSGLEKLKGVVGTQLERAVIVYMFVNKDETRKGVGFEVAMCGEDKTMPRSMARWLEGRSVSESRILTSHTVAQHTT